MRIQLREREIETETEIERERVCVCVCDYVKKRGDIERIYLYLRMNKITRVGACV